MRNRFLLLAIVVILCSTLLIFIFDRKPKTNTANLKSHKQDFKVKKMDISMLSKPIVKSEKTKRDVKKLVKRKKLSSQCLKAYEYLNSKDFLDLKFDDLFWNNYISCVKKDFKVRYNLMKGNIKYCTSVNSNDLQNNSYCLDLLLSLKWGIFLALNPDKVSQDLTNLEDQELFGLYLGEMFNNEKQFIVADDFKKKDLFLREMYNRYPESKSVNQLMLMNYSVYAENDPINDQINSYFDRYFPDDESYLSLKYRNSNDFELQEAIFNQLMQREYPQVHHVLQHSFSIWKQEGKVQALNFLKDHIGHFSERYNSQKLVNYKKYSLDALNKHYSNIESDSISKDSNWVTFSFPEFVPLMMGER